MPEKKDVLIIDDEPEVSEVLHMYLENMERFRRIITASDGALASKKLANQNFGLILLDMNLPKKNGLDILKELSKHTMNSVDNVVVISGELDKDKLQTAISRGVKHFIVKPFDEEGFKSKVKKIVS